MDILSGNPQSIILRTNFLAFGPSYKPTFVDRVLNASTHNQHIYLPDDVIFNPVSVFILVKSAEYLLQSSLYGLFHLAADDKLSKYELGLMLCEHFSLSSSLILPTTMSALPSPVPRPSNMSLSNQLISAQLPYAIGTLTRQISDLASLPKLSNYL